MMTLQFTVNLKFASFNFKAHLGCLRGFLVPCHSFVAIDVWPVFEGNNIVQLFTQRWKAIYSLLIPTIMYYPT